MNEPPPLPGNPHQNDVYHLKLLAMFHFIGAGLAFLALLFLLAHFAMFHMVFENPAIWANPQGGSPPPMAFLAIFKWFYLIFGTWFAGSCIVNVLSGLYIHARKHRIFSLVVAGINCLHVPLGTLLGVFTILVLLRDSVQKLYEASENARHV